MYMQIEMENGHLNHPSPMSSMENQGQWKLDVSLVYSSGK